MSMREIRASFASGLAGKGTLQGARLNYDKTTGKDMQRIAFDVLYPDGQVHEITQLLAGNADLRRAAYDLGAATAQDIEGGA